MDENDQAVDSTSDIECNPKSIERLGFIAQKENVYNQLLPYASQIDEESVKMLATIKANLGKSVLMRETKPGCGVWSARLLRYIKMYGMKFSKEDHLVLVHLMYELVTIPKLEPWLVSRFATVLTMLLKKKDLLSPAELSLPWRPLYELLERITSTSHGTLGMYRFFTSLESTLDSLVSAARVYFPLSATQEMLDEWRPKLCPFDNVTMCHTIELIERFLPVTIPHEQASLGYELWLNEFLCLWDKCSNAPMWEGDMMWIMARLAGQTIGYINWEPYIPLMFTRFQHSLNLPVAYKQLPPPRLHKLETGPMALWIVSVLGGGSSCQKYLSKFMTAIESYFHPANSGRWLLKLKELLRKLPLYFVQRVHLERHKKLASWQQPVPDAHKLTEADITNFVESIKPVALQAMFSKLGATEASQALQHLATLRPNIIVPQVLDRMYANLETLTEPHKLTAAMQCVLGVARPMMDASYKEGSTHVIPLLMAVLPGIDPNDLKKSFVTFQFISTFASMIPIVDSSKASDHWQDLTEVETTVCLATADLEDFVLQFMDRCFVIVESSSLENTRLEQRDSDKRSKLENMAEGALASTCSSLLTQTSPQIFKSALRKLHTFVTSRILETKVSGHFIAAMCRCFARTNPTETLRLLMPHLCDTILALTESADVLKEEMLDKELLYNMLLLSELVDCKSNVVIRYMPQVMAVLDRTLHLTCREGYFLASGILNNTLGCMSNIAPLDYRSMPTSFDRPISEYLPIRDWGKPGDVHNLEIKWQMPGDQEVAVVQQVMDKYLTPELLRITQFSDNQLQLTREELQCSLCIIISLLNCKTLLPIWQEPPLNLWESCLPADNLPLVIRYGVVTMPDGANVRKTLVDVMNKLQLKLLQSQEDDTKSFFSLITIWECLLLNRIGTRNSFESHWKSFHLVKKVLENKLLGEKRHLRALLVDRAVLQHDLLTEYSTESLTATHSQIMVNLLTLSTSHYSEVRARAQAKLFAAVEKFTYSYTVLVPHLLHNLQQDSNLNHEQFKGSLYVLLGPKQNPMVTRHDWGLLKTLWPAIIRAQPSEKLSVIRLLETLVESVHKHFPTITINLEIPDGCLDCAKMLWLSAPAPLLPLVEADDIKAGLEKRQAINSNNFSEYLKLLDAIMDAIDQGNLHWRYNSMAMSFLRDLVHPDLTYPARIVNCFLQALISDSLELRKIGVKGVVFCLKQQKRPHKKIMIPTTRPDVPQPGNRPDNAWIQYNEKNKPVTSEQWDQPRYVHKPYHGFYTWPKEVAVYAPSSEQPPLDRKTEELTAEEKEVDAFFSDSANIAKLISFLSLEEKKGKDKFNGFRFIMFKSLFRNHGNQYLPLFVPHLQRLVADKLESSQRCASEIIAGAIRGCKHWSFEKVAALWEILDPLIKTALNNMTVESMGDWGICFATSAENRDPNRQHWLLEILMDEPLRDDASFIKCGRLYTLQGAANQQQWRLQEVFHRLLAYFKPNLTHSFQNVRERIASVLVNIFETDIVLGLGTTTSSPLVAEFMEEVLPQLAVLHRIVPKAVENNHNHKTTRDESHHASGKHDQQGVDLSLKLKNVKLNDEDRDVAIRLLKTVCRWVNGSIGRTQHGTWPAFYSLLPIVSEMASYEGDEELNKTCNTMLAALSQVLTSPDYIPFVLATLTDVSKSSSWSARLTCLEFLQVFVFHNMPTLICRQTWIDQVSTIALRSLEDDWLDVREKASQVLGGLLHCDFMEDTDQLLAKFKVTARTKLSKKKLTNALDAEGIERIKLRHSGVLGLCAFINAYPYDVPAFVPDIFSILGDHLNDPQPIPSTIRKTLGDFKRTHHDNWQAHSLKFTEEQLAVLSDLTIPPSYYA